jgi:hypothetical protein
MMADLNNAIQLIREGRKPEAQRILEPLIKADPANIQAWFWYVETYPTLEKRVQVLEMCLKMNPGNAQVLAALQTLNKQHPPQSSVNPPMAQAVKPAPQQPSISYSSSPPAYVEERPVVTNPSQQKKAWENMDSYVDNSALSRPKPLSRSYSFYDVWLTVLTSFDIEPYEDMLKDPEASASRGFEWVAYAGIASGLLAPLSIVNNPAFTELKNMPEFQGMFGNMGMTAFLVFLAFASALITPIVSVIALALGAGIQNVLAVFFGGNGDYSRTVYAIAAYLAPITILIALLGIIPVVGQCLTGLISLYNLILNVRALRAAHSISTWQALGVIVTPTILLTIFLCLVMYVAAPGILSS